MDVNQGGLCLFDTFATTASLWPRNFHQQEVTMSLIKYEPMHLLSRMQNELNHFFARDDVLFPSLTAEEQSLLGGEWLPRADLKEDDNQYTVTADIPGVDPKDVQVTLENGVLTLKGERKSEKEETRKHYRRKECMYGSFERSFRLPDTADGDNVKASSKNGVVTIQIPKKAAAKAKSIKIEST